MPRGISKSDPSNESNWTTSYIVSNNYPVTYLLTKMFWNQGTDL